MQQNEAVSSSASAAVSSAEGTLVTPTSTGSPISSKENDEELEKRIKIWGLVIQSLTPISILLAVMRFSHERRRREIDDVLGINESATKHNAGLTNEEHQAIAHIEGLQVPQDKIEAKMYWGARLVHLSHLNMVWRVWEVTKGMTRGSGYDGWIRFARVVIANRLLTGDEVVRHGGRDPRDLAAADLWRALEQYEPFPKKFVLWLRSLNALTVPRKVPNAK
jgi:hypothetical protein